jgi:hypothetical protein
MRRVKYEFYKYGEILEGLVSFWEVWSGLVSFW